MARKKNAELSRDQRARAFAADLLASLPTQQNIRLGNLHSISELPSQGIF